MRKGFLALLMLFAFIGLAGCNGEDVITTVEIPNYIDAPQNLSITGNVLSWNAVTGATGYIVYANDVEKATVTGTSYDFTAIATENLVFRVKTDAPTGMLDSNLSASVAFVLNSAQEIIAVQDLLDDINEEMPEGIAEELVRKGLTSTDLNVLITAVDTLQTSMNAADDTEDFQAMNTALKTFLATDMNMEAVVSAMIVTVIPDQLQYEIDWRQDEIEYYQEYVDEYPYYQNDIDYYQDSIDMYQDLIDMLTESSDEMVVGIVETMEYFIAIQEEIDNELIGHIEGLMDTESISTLNAEEVILVKDEFVTIMEENIPTVEQILMMIEIADSMVTVMAQDDEAPQIFGDYAAQYSTQLLLMIDAFIAFIDNFDLAFVNEIKNLDATVEAEDLLQAEIMIHVITYIDNFFEENEALLDSISAVFTDAQKETIFDDAVASLMAQLPEESEDMGMTMGMAMISSVYLDFFSNVEFTQLLGLSMMMEDAMEALMDSFVASDGEIVRLIVTMNNFEHDWEEETYSNAITGATYANGTEEAYAQSLLAVDIYKEAINHLNAVFETVEDDDMDNVADVLLAAMPLELLLTQMYEVETIEATQLAALQANFEIALTSIIPDMVNLLKNVVAYAVDEELGDSLGTLMTSIHNYFVAEYGADYEDDYAYWDDDYQSLSMTIFLAGQYDQFMISANEGLVNSLFDAFLTYVKTAEFLALSGVTLETMNELESDFDEAFAFVNSELAIIKGYNAGTITSAETIRINTFGQSVIAPFMEESTN